MKLDYALRADASKVPTLRRRGPGDDGSAMPQERVTADQRRSSRVEERQLRAIIEKLADGIVIVGADGLIRFANPAAAQLFARSVPELVGTVFGSAIAGGAPAEIDVVRPGGDTITAELRVVEVTWEGEAARLVSIRDVTDRRRAEEHALQAERERTARAEAEAANRAKSEFLATMSHELRTPLNAVMGYAQLLNLGIGGKLSPDQQRQIERIAASGRHLLGLVNEVLDLAKIDAGRLTVHIAPASAAGTAEAAATLIQPSAEARGVALGSRPAGGAGEYYLGDEDRVRQILVNLLTNAVKFTDAGGRVTVELGHSSEPDADARLRRGGRYTFFRVTDTGIGMPADRLSSIFEPFVQIESGRTRTNDGSGLGLAISRRLARLMRGDITVRSSIGAGSAFTLWLPSASLDAGETVVVPVAAPEGSPPLRGLADIGDILMRSLQPLLETFVRRLREECPAPGAASLRFSQLADHVASYLADLAGILITLEESGGQPSGLLVDAADIHRLVAGRHGAQRARLGWSEDALRCEYRVLSEEIERIVRQSEGAIDPASRDEALAVVARLLEQAEQTSLRAFATAGGATDDRRG